MTDEQIADPHREAELARWQALRADLAEAEALHYGDGWGADAWPGVLRKGATLRVVDMGVWAFVEAFERAERHVK